MTSRLVSAASTQNPGLNLSPWAWAVIIVVAIFFTYTNSFPGAFFFDDADAILNNPTLRHLFSWHVLWPPVSAGIGGRPFANLVFALNYALFGTDPAAWHAINLVIHAAAALLLFGVAHQALRGPVLAPRYADRATTLAALVALAWALHPVQTNIVDYASQRTEGLMSALYLLTLYGFARAATTGSVRWAIATLIACALGMATKEGMVTVPVMLVLYDRTFLSGNFADGWRQHRRSYVLFAASWIILAALMATSHLSARGVGFSLGRTWYQYGLTEIQAVARYLKLSVWPHPLVFDYGPTYLQHFADARSSALVLGVAMGATLYALWRAPVAGFAGAWFFGLLAPSSSVVPVAQQPCAENRMYLALAGVTALIVVSGYRLLGRRALTGFGIAAVALGITTFERNPVFQNEIAVWADTVPKRPTNERAENNLGNALLKAGHVNESMPHFEAAIRLSPSYADAHNNRGVVLLRWHRPQDAVPDFKMAIEDKKDYGDAYYNLGEAYLELNQSAAAVAPLEAAIRINPTNAKAHNNLGIALLDTGRIQASLDEERWAITLDPNLPEAHYNLGNSLDRAGDTAAALREFEKTVRLDPRFAKAYNNAGVMQLRLNRLDDAARNFETALELKPDYPEARQNLALARRTAP